uniref:Uncharacterized protein n=1 Tax=Anguilla anguilla TaxID=7936 RepID=A0A0E9PHJ5_ANGAN
MTMLCSSITHPLGYLIHYLFLELGRQETAGCVQFIPVFTFYC